jgi:chemotaxis family two-component system sensor kinase Cph1
VDMSRSILRHVSVMYTGYLKNIRAQATMVMPLMKAGRLWGLISCMHHAAPLHVACEARTAMDLLSHMVSLLLAEQEDRDTAIYRQRMSDSIGSIGHQLEQQADYYRGLTEGAFSLHGWIESTGAALATEHGIVLLGKTPTQEQVSGIAAWLTGHADSKAVFATERLAELYPPAAAFQATASGLLAARLMQSRTGFVMWFRPEIIQTVAWAGDPRKPVAANRAEPRHGMAGL